MDNPTHTVEQAVTLLREHMETIRINLDILEMLKSNGRIRETDQPYIEITSRNWKNQQIFNKFVFTELPWFLNAEQKPGNQAMKKKFLDWAANLHLEMTRLDRMLKDYLREILSADESQADKLEHQEIKDQRFWSFLDHAKGQTKLFLSFDDPDHPDESDQPLDSEENEE